MNPRTYKIAKGDTLGGIASREKTSVQDLLKLNPNIKNPNLIYEGSSLNLPGQAPAPTVLQPQAPTPAPTVTQPIVSPFQSSRPSPSSISSVISERAQPKSSRDSLIERMSGALSSASSFDPNARRAQLETERGVSKTRETISTFEDEVAKANTLLDQIDEDITKRTGDFLVSDPARRRILASESAPILKSLGIASRGAEAAQSRLTREQGDITDIISQEQTAAERPLSFLGKELGLRSDIDALTADERKSEREMAITDLVSQGVNDPLELYDYLNFDEEGNRIGDMSLSEINNVLKAGTESKKGELELQKLQAEVAKINDPLDRKEQEARIAKLYKDMEEDPLDDEYKRAQIDNIYSEIAARNNDMARGVLTDKEVKALDDSPQGKNVRTLGDLKQKLNGYRELVKLYGTSSFGAQKAKLNAAFADLKIAYKTAAELGALQGPDILLLEEALKPASFANPVTQLLAKTTGSGVGAIEANLTQADEIIQRSADTSISQLYARNPKYKDSEYVASLVQPFSQKTLKSLDDEFNDFVTP